MTISSISELYSKAVSLGLGEDLEAVWSWILQKEELVSHSQPPPALVKYQNLRYQIILPMLTPIRHRLAGSIIAHYFSLFVAGI
jgi:hypothetical protein